MHMSRPAMARAAARAILRIEASASSSSTLPHRARRCVSTYATFPPAASLHVDLPVSSEKRPQGPDIDKVKIHFFRNSVLVKGEHSSDTISYARLRDNCRCTRCVDPSTKQKLHTSGSVKDADAVKAREGFQSGKQGLYVGWKDRHESFYPWDEVFHMTSRQPYPHDVYTQLTRTFWNRDKLEQSDLRMSYPDVSTTKGLLRMLRQAQQYGIVIVSGVPTERTSDDDCELRRFVNRIGVIRNTFYGETWDVKSVENSRNIAYTSQDLGLHMDLLYFTSPPRFQALHCLRNKVEGGSSYFADAFYAGRHIQRVDMDTAQTLSRYPLDFEYVNDGHHMRCRHFVLNKLDTLRSSVNWSPPFQAPTRRLARSEAGVSLSVDIDKAFYHAMAKFEAALARPEAQFEFRMNEGDLVFFDNRRVVHARRAFGPGERWLKGCYVDGDVVWDTMATLAAA